MTAGAPNIPQRILVVEDEPDLRRLVSTDLRDAGFDVLEATSGEEAIRTVEAEAIELVVLDMVLPGISGLDVVHALRERSRTSTLPVILMTGFGSEVGVVAGLGAGADDFIAKPVRLDELEARVRAHLRNGAAWSTVVEADLRRRSAVVEALGHLAIVSTPEEAAQTIVAELARRTTWDFIAVSRLSKGDRLLELATFNRAAGMRPGGTLLGPNISRDSVTRARLGPWVEDIVPPIDDVRTAAFSGANLDIGAGAPIYAGEELVGVLALGVTRDPRQSAPARKANLLAAAIDYASILSVVAGPALADRRTATDVRARLELVLAEGAFHPVFQPIVNLETMEVVGYEALTRFKDGARPDLRFAEAASVDLGQDFELAAIGAALDEATPLPPGAFLSLNVSPRLLVENGGRLRAILQGTDRELVLEMTEHARIDDYVALRVAITSLGDVGLAVDDAGAGYASLRHVLELRPTFAKLDISLVQGIALDEVRQALVAGLQYFAIRSGCRLIAEGVESEDDAAVLRQLRVEFAQGYLFGRPETVGPMPDRQADRNSGA